MVYKKYLGTWQNESLGNCFEQKTREILKKEPIYDTLIELYWALFYVRAAEYGTRKYSNFKEIESIMKLGIVIF